jgi:hypothetical protein
MTCAEVYPLTVCLLNLSSSSSFFFFFFFLVVLFCYLVSKTISLTNNRFKLQRVQYTISRILPLQRALVSGKEQILVGFWGFTR